MYKKIKITTPQTDSPRSGVMIIYTGGTFGMAHNDKGVLVPFDFSHILSHLPTIRNLSLDLTVISFEHPIDSSNVDTTHWQSIGTIIYENYNEYNGFVVLHGTDTMAFTTSALSFMMPGLNKPVVFTGAQLPISEARSDARENLITALAIAGAQQDGKPLVPEVCLYFGDELIRGCRAKKVESMRFDAFQSENYPPLAKAGVKIDYDLAAIRPYDQGSELRLLTRFDTNIALLKLFPGISENTVRSITEIGGLKGLVIETYGSGNAPSSGWFTGLIKKAIEKNVIVLNISQCPGGMVMQGKYETSRTLEEVGVISGGDMTTESAVTKLMLLLGEFGSEEARHLITQSLAGELSV
jgi:L-asparaginase